MRIKENIRTMLAVRNRVSGEVAAVLIENPRCLDGDSQKEKAYQVAIQYFADKEKDCKTPEGISTNSRTTIELQVLVECYKEESDDKKQEYAMKIGRMLIETAKHYLMRVPDELKEDAFQIAIKYLENQMNA